MKHSLVATITLVSCFSTQWACNHRETSATAEVKATSAAPVTSLADIKALSSSQLADLFARGTSAPIPSQDNPSVKADGEGYPILAAGGGPLNTFANTFWQGKVFTTTIDAAGVKHTTLDNKLAGDLVRDISANVYVIDRGLTGDGKPSILLDYSKSNRISARPIRDEIRNVAPGLYLGRANIENTPLSQPILGKYSFVLWFALSFKTAP